MNRNVTIVYSKFTTPLTEVFRAEFPNLTGQDGEDCERIYQVMNQSDPVFRDERCMIIGDIIRFDDTKKMYEADLMGFRAVCPSELKTFC